MSAFEIYEYAGSKKVLASGQIIVRDSEPAILKLIDNGEVYHEVEIHVRAIGESRVEKGLEVNQIDDDRSRLEVTMPAGDSVMLHSNNPFGTYNGKHLHASFLVSVTQKGAFACLYTFSEGDPVEQKRKKRK